MEVFIIEHPAGPPWQSREKPKPSQLLSSVSDTNTSVHRVIAMQLCIAYPSNCQRRQSSFHCPPMYMRAMRRMTGM